MEKRCFQAQSREIYERRKKERRKITYNSSPHCHSRLLLWDVAFGYQYVLLTRMAVDHMSSSVKKKKSMYGMKKKSEKD